MGLDRPTLAWHALTSPVREGSQLCASPITCEHSTCPFSRGSPGELRSARLIRSRHCSTTGITGKRLCLYHGRTGHASSHASGLRDVSSVSTAEPTPRESISSQISTSSESGRQRARACKQAATCDPRPQARSRLPLSPPHLLLFLSSTGASAVMELIAPTPGASVLGDTSSPHMALCSLVWTGRGQCLSFGDQPSRPKRLIVYQYDPGSPRHLDRPLDILLPALSPATSAQRQATSTLPGVRLRVRVVISTS